MYDYHTHSVFSDDCNTPTSDMIEAAIKLGFKEIAITDHYDPLYPNKDIAFALDFDLYDKEINKLKLIYKDKIKVLKGLELGLQKKAIPICKDVVSQNQFDFILGSFHCAENIELFGGEYFLGRSIKEAFEAFYTYIDDTLRLFDGYSVIGHFNIIERYIDALPSDNSYMDIVEKTFSYLIEQGKGIELNTSSFRYNMGDSLTPSLGMLKLYKHLGGEIITLGSDAHFAKDVGDSIKRGEDILKSLGYKYITTFEDLKPTFISI